VVSFFTAQRLVRCRAAPDPAPLESERPPTGADKVVPEGCACVVAVSFAPASAERVGRDGPVKGRRGCDIRRPGRGPFLPQEQIGREPELDEQDFCVQDLGLPPLGASRDCAGTHTVGSNLVSIR
jgi:hypothetical protein